MEFIVIEVAVRYIQYIAYTDCVKRYKAYKGKVFRRGEEDDQPGRYLQDNPEKSNNGIHLKVE